jgi:hypothetical protein
MTDDTQALLRNLDRRVRLLELHCSKEKKPKPPGAKRPRGRPKGSRNKPGIRVGDALFAEHQLDGTQMVALSALEGWVKVSVHRRPARHMSKLVDDKTQWMPPNWGFDVATKSWARLCALRDCAATCDELAALREALKAAEHLPVDNVKLLHRGLSLVEESLQLPQQFMPPSAA